jgi:hypothetical protein
MSWAHVLDQGLTGLVLQLLKGGSTDVDRQGYSCGEGCAYGPGFQMAGAFSLQAEHNLSHAVYLVLSGSILGLPSGSGGCLQIRGTGPAGTCLCSVRRASPAQQPALRAPARGTFLWGDNHGNALMAVQSLPVLRA